MSAIESINGTSAIVVAARSCRETSGPDDCGTLVPQGWFAGLVTRVWPSRSRAKMLRFHLDSSERTARAWASGDREPDAWVLGALLRSDDGGLVLDKIMAGAAPRWWREHLEDRFYASAYRQTRIMAEQQLKLALE